MVVAMTLGFLIRNTLSLAVGILFGLTGGYAVALLGLGYGPMIILILFGLVMMLSICTAAQMISSTLSRVATKRVGPRVRAIVLAEEGWHIWSRVAVFLGAYAIGVVLSVRVPLDLLGKTIGGY